MIIWEDWRVCGTKKRPRVAFIDAFYNTPIFKVHHDLFPMSPTTVGVERHQFAVRGFSHRPIQGPDGKRLANLIAELNNETFATRDAAMKVLSKLSDLAAPSLRDSQDKPSSPEARRLIEQLLLKFDGQSTSGEPLRMSRAVQVLEHIATAEARQLLAELAKGWP
jgi:hypothetical protein